ncbi:MAG: glycosyltransferase family 39 protein [Candidatus Microgenomates bacterium]|jgi:4-amino-4-deoxy-L-arabinose transferase-like glycosyltransferase
MPAFLNKFIKTKLFPILIFCLALFLRIYHLNLIYTFTADEEYQTDIAMTLVKHLHLIWIGVNAANTGFYLGPFWSYFTAFWLFLSHGDPLITAYVAAIIGAITCAVIFYVGSKMFSFRVGLVTSILYACLPLIVFFDQKYWNPTTVPLLAVTMLYSLYKVKDNQKFWLLFALAYGLVFHAHLSLVPFIVLALYQLRKGIKIKVFAQSALVFILTISPLIVFDYFHKWSNITTILRLKQIASAMHPSSFSKMQSLAESIMRLWYLNPHTITANEILFICSKYRSFPSLVSLPFIILILIFFFTKNTWLKENSRILALGILLIASSYVFFPESSSEYYLLGLFPLLLFIPGIIWNKYISPLLIVIICSLGIFSVLTAYNPYGLSVKKEIVSSVMSKIGNKTYELNEEGVCHKYEGWRYLFATYGKAPERSNIDSNFGWLYPNEIHNGPVNYSVTITGHDTNPLGFSTQILKNSNK